MATEPLRMYGLSSGLDTEALVEAMTATTKQKITNKNREVITLQWKQEAYQDITSKLSDFQSKYFDILSSKNNLRSPSTYNKYKADVYSVGTNGVNAEGTPAGVSVRPIDGAATPGEYSVKVIETATQAKYQGKAMDNNALDLSAYTDASKTYSFNITTGGKTATVTFNGGSKEDVVKNINQQLADSFGEANNTSSTGKGMVYISDSGKISSADRSAVNIGGIVNMEDDVALNFAGMKTGDNKLNVIADGKSYEISFKSYADGYFASAPAAEKSKMQENYFMSEAEKLMNAEIEAGTLTREELVPDEDAFKLAMQQDKDEKYDEALFAAKDKYEAELKSNYEAGKKSGSITDSYDDWVKTQKEFDEEAFKKSFTYDEAAFRQNYEIKQYINKAGLKAEDYTLDDAALTSFANKYEMRQAIKNITLSDGTGLKLSDDGILSAENGTTKVGVEAAADSVNTLGAASATTSAVQVTTATTLKELGIEDKATFSINGVSFTFDKDYTVKRMMAEINNASSAGAVMSFSTLTNSFSLSSSAYGTSAKIDFKAEAGSEGEALLTTLGLTSGTFTKGTNLQIEVNGETVETASNSYNVDGTTLSFTSSAKGAEFTYEVKKDTASSVDAIKEFVEDYNKLLEDVYKYIDEKPDKDYHALTDEEIEEMDLSEKQQEKWETRAKQGILYHDNTVMTIMNKLRSILNTSIETADGQKFSLYDMGIKGTVDYTKHGKLIVDEKKLENAFDKYSDQIEQLFSGSKINDKGELEFTGIMAKLNDTLTGAVKSTGNRKTNGTLVKLAGEKSGLSATDNTIFDQLKKMNKTITDLEDRYERQQDRWWKYYTSIETMMSNLNSQTQYINQLMFFE